MALLFISALFAFDETPEKTVQAFIEAFNKRDQAGLVRRVVGQKNAGFPFSEGMPTVKTKLGEVKVEGDTATVEVESKLSNSAPSAPPMKETVNLRLVDGDWRIVPVPVERIAGNETIVGVIALMVTDERIARQAKPAAEKTQCLSNIKQLSTAVIIYSTDHDDFLPKSAAEFKKAIMPYVKNEAIFHCPLDKSGAASSYFLDPRMAGKSVVSIDAPAETAMVVEGSPSKTAFRHDGKATLGYLDGHAKIVTPDQMRRARTIALK